MKAFFRLSPLLRTLLFSAVSMIMVDTAIAAPSIIFDFQYGNFSVYGTPVSQTYFWTGDGETTPVYDPNPIGQGGWTTQYSAPGSYFIGLSTINNGSAVRYYCGNATSNDVINTSQLSQNAMVTINFTSFDDESGELSCTCSSIPDGVCGTYN